MMQLIVATKNPGKAREIAAILSDLPLEVLFLQDFPQIPEIVEDGETFQDNARKKAETVLNHTGGIVLADDSGLEVDALGGEPGVYSARYSGEEATDFANNAKLLQQLLGVPPHKRTARFCCVMAIAAPGQETSIVEGYCRGIITGEPRGDGGFGYDPLFLVPAYDKTFAELPPDVKNEISHRSRAMARAKMVLEKFLKD